MPPKAARPARRGDGPVARTHPLLAWTLVLALLGYTALVGRLHYSLPTPVAHDVDPRTGAPVFNEVRRDARAPLTVRRPGPCPSSTTLP